MGTLKTTLKVESSDLFPTPVSFTNVNNNSIGATISSFTTIAVSGAITLATIPASNAYLYVSAPLTNTQDIVLKVGVGGTTFASIAPGNVGFFPIGNNSGYTLQANTASGTQYLNYYIGSK